MIAKAGSRMPMIGVMAMVALIVSGPACAATRQHETSVVGWTSRPPLNIARVGATAATINGLIVEVGGFDPVQQALIAPTEARRTIGSGVWHFVATVRTPRANAAAATFGGQVWVVGGYGEGDPPVDVVERYDPFADAWSRGPALPEGRAQAGAAVLHGVLYVVGGDVAFGEGERVTASGVAFDPRKHRWTPITPLPAPRDRLRLIAAGDYLYAIGGATPSKDSLAAVDRYDPRTGKWTSIAAMNQTRSVPGATVIGRGRDARIAVVGGCELVAGTRVQLRRTTEVFDPVTRHWRLLSAQLPTGRCSLAAATEADGTVLAIGGVVSDIVSHDTATAAVDALRL
jgi:influenza virus NS1A-binding protein